MEKKLSEIIIGCAIKIHKELGPGLLESFYQKCLFHELTKQGVKCQTEVMIPLLYDTLNIESGFRANIIVENKIIIEIKSLETLAPVHKAQVLTYLKVSEKPLALLINFGQPYVKDGIHRFANGEEGNTL